MYIYIYIYYTHKQQLNRRRVLHKPIPISALFEQSWGCLDSAVDGGDGKCRARRCCRGREFESHGGSLNIFQQLPA